MISVTRILAPYADFSRVPPAILEQAAMRGTRVHAACAAHALGVFVAAQGPDAQPYFDSFCQWFDQAVEEVIAVEQRLVHPLGFCGHPDLIVRIQGDDCLSVVDNKTPRAAGKTWAAQLAAYLKMAQEAGHNAKRAMSLRLKSDGTYPVLDEYTLTEADWAGFLNAFYAHRYFSKEG